MNLTNKIIYKQEITFQKIHSALNVVGKTICDFYDINAEELKDFNSKTIREDDKKLAPISHKLIKDLLNIDNLNASFIEDIFNINISGDKKRGLKHLAKEFHEKYGLTFTYAEAYAASYNQCLSLLLMQLHFEGLINLPFCFNIPQTKSVNSISGKRKRIDLGIHSYPDMLRQIRSIDSQDSASQDCNFMSNSSKTILVSYGSRVLIALGWNSFQDVSLKDLLTFKNEAPSHSHFNSALLKQPPYALLVSYLHKKNPHDFNINLDQWNTIVWKQAKSKKDNQQIDLLLQECSIPKREKLKTNELSGIFSNNLSQENIKLSTIPKKIFGVAKLEELKDYLPLYESTIDNWMAIENSYLKKRRVENYKTLESAISYWNMYLFYLLPLWYKNNTSSVPYPSTPNAIKGSIFISTLIPDGKIKPPTFMDFLDGMQQEKSLRNETVYSALKNIEKLFDFIETYSDELPGSSGFTQPISSLDYPKIQRSIGTNKGLIPRHIFSFLINYIEAIACFNSVVNQRVLDGEISKEWLEQICSNNCIDTIEVAEQVGFIPFIHVDNSLVIIKEIPNLLDLKVTSLKDGRILKINYPHVLHHILVILQTGIRSNHVQWLDAEKFDCMVKSEEDTFVSLYVNTDKAKNNAWTPIVHKRVIETLREQLKWRNLVSNAEFNKTKFYNNNPKSKWGQFHPLFSYTTAGLPYADSHYSDAWIKILAFFQSFLKQTSLKPIELAQLLPPGIKFNEFNLDTKLKEYGDKCTNVCDLRWTSDITPHSARVSVVSNYITALPAEMIGQYITGQTQAVVHHYVKLDPTYLTEIEQGQKEGLAKLAMEQQFNQLTGRKSHHPILADKEGSNLAKSLSISKEQTIAQYGCISLNLKEDSKTGVDILLEESNIKLAFNKTEICPYNNNCPADLIKEMKGFRRCGVCPYAVRSIDHLPAIAVKKRQFMELLEEIEGKLVEASSNNSTIEELDRIEEERQRITEELLGWIVSEEMLEANRKRLELEPATSQYLVKKPEILVQNLQQMSTKHGDIEYLLTRLADCQSFPNLETPIVRAKFDLLRRQLLARLGDFKNAFDMKLPTNPSHECLGVLKEVINRYKLSHEQTVELLSTNMLSLPNESKQLLELNYGK